jgi:5S rRNA maturation endonuclease (ribonuclease M5)
MDFLEEFNNHIKKIKKKNLAVVVEGKRDKIALTKLDLKNIFTLNSSLYDVCEKIASNFDEVIILTDRDKEGKKLYINLKQNFDRCGVKINNDFRNFLFKYSKLSHIEGIDTYIQNIQNRSFDNK